MSPNQIPTSRVIGECAPGSDDCPYLNHPLPRCYCRTLSSRTIPKMMRYCLNRHLLCPVLNDSRPEGGAATTTDKGDQP